MRLKYIIAVILGGGGILFGVYNWISFFKGQAAAPAAQVQALRPQPNPRVAEVEQAAASRGQPADAGPDSQFVSPEGLELPDTLGRNPFLTPDEIEAVARGEIFAQPVQVAQAPAIALPNLILTGLVQDNVSGNYQAIIEGRIYREGDNIGPEKILEITGNAVVLEYGGRTRSVELRKRAGEGVANIKLKNKP